MITRRRLSVSQQARPGTQSFRLALRLWGPLGICVLGLALALLFPSRFPGKPAGQPHSEEPSLAGIGRKASKADHACRFWGMIGSSPQDSILNEQLVSGTHALINLGESNQDGWGVAYYSPGMLPPELDRPQLLRGGPKANHESDHGFREAVTEMLGLDAYCAMAHVRNASPGHTGIPDPHPFWREGVTFVHNGGFNTSPLISLLEQNAPNYLETCPPHYRDPYLDSELFLLYILKMRAQGVDRGDGVRSFSLEDVIAEAALDAYDAGAIQTAANCLIATADTLIALRFDINDVDWYKARYRETPGAWMIASEPVGTDTTGWEVLPPKSLGIFTATGPPEIITVFPPQGPYIFLGETTIDDDLEGDSAGNGDGDCDAGERVELIIALRNEGTETATNVRASIATEDSCCQILDDYEEYGDIAPGEEVPCLEDFDLAIAPQCPDGHQIAFSMTVESDNPETWERYFTLDVEAPLMELVCHMVDDTLCGNGNGRIEPGETFHLITRLSNSGSEDATTLQVSLAICHPLVTVTQGEASLDTLHAGGEAEPSPPFEVEVPASCPDPDVLFATVVVNGDWDQSACFEFMMPVGGFYDDMEDGPGSWTSYVVTAGYVDQWHHSQQRNYTPGGEWSWKFGDTGGGDYQNLSDGALESEPTTLRSHSYLRFRHWMEAEVSAGHPGYCYDGGMVELSVNGGEWEQIFPVGGYPYQIYSSGSNPAPWPAETEVYSGDIDWEEATFEITGYEGDARFRFRFGSDGSVVREGWYIDEVEFFGTDTLWSGADEVTPLVLHPGVEQNRPNPSGPGTVISYRVPESREVLLQIFDPTGRLVRTLVTGRVEAGMHVVSWDGRNNAGAAMESGTYFYRFRTAGMSQSRKLVLIKQER
ncbi:MAG: T9SS type A sorting domain-containing protein [Candidatus Eisenbacteria sp.]|nr:T9SS type A sorting domain-containing protein [Candidatus Eisenbacteria bacterium]